MLEKDKKWQNNQITIHNWLALCNIRRASFIVLQHFSDQKVLPEKDYPNLMLNVHVVQVHLNEHQCTEFTYQFLVTVSSLLPMIYYQIICFVPDSFNGPNVLSNTLMGNHGILLYNKIKLKKIWSVFFDLVT